MKQQYYAVLAAMESAEAAQLQRRRRATYKTDREVAPRPTVGRCAAYPVGNAQLACSPRKYKERRMRSNRLSVLGAGDGGSDVVS